MTDITRIFNVETRAFTNVQRKYSGQVNDSISTTLHFEYNPATFLDGDEYTPYIVFNIHDIDGNPLIYGPDSTPKFNGWEFSIPWDVTSRVKTNRVEYQLFFVKTNIVFNGNVAQLDSTEYIQSAMDGIALKKSIGCKPSKSCCPPMAPSTEPNVVGYINLWKEYGMVVPVEQQHDVSKDKLILIFHTYNGNQDCELELSVPVLEDGKIPHRYLDMVESISYENADVEDYKIPSAKAVVDWLVKEYTSKDFSVAKWEADRTYRRESVVVHNDNIYISLQDDNKGNEPIEDTTVKDEYWSTVSEYDLIINEWSEVPRTNKVPSEALIVPALDSKLDDSQVISDWNELDPELVGQKIQIPSGKLTKDTLDSKLDDSQLVTLWSAQPSNDNIASERLTKNSLDAKLDDSQLVTDWNELSDSKIPSQKLTKDTLDTKLDDSQVITSWGIPTDEEIPSAKLTKDSLDDKTDFRMAIRFWYPEVMYGNGSTVIYDGTIYISRGDENRGHVPSDSTESRVWWSKIEGGGSSDDPSKFVDIIGNGTDTIYYINHGLNTSEVFYTMRYNDSQRMFTDADVYVIDDNNIRVETYEPLETDSVVIILTPMINETSKAVTIGNGEDTEFIIEHNFGTYNYFSSVRNIETGLFVRANIFALDATRAKIVFTNPPPTDSIRVVLTSIMKVSEGSQAIYSFENMDTWVVEHNLGKVVMVQAFSTDGTELTGNIKQDMSGLNSVTIEFDEPLSGFVIVR